METVYTERANGRREYWTYANGQRIYISAAMAERMRHQGARIVNV